MRKLLAVVFCFLMIGTSAALAGPPIPSPPTPPKAVSKLSGATTAKRLDEEIKTLRRQGYVLSRYHRSLRPDGTLKSYSFTMHKGSKASSSTTSVSVDLHQDAAGKHAKQSKPTTADITVDSDTKT